MKRRKFLTGAMLTASASSLALPSLAQSTKEMVIVSSWVRDLPGIGLPAQRLAARIQELTDGDIRVTYYAAGERVGAFDSFDEVASGNAQAYISADYYWKGKHPGWAAFTSIPFGLIANEIDAWVKYAGGQELWDELANKFGLKCLAMGNSGMQLGGWFNKKIDSADDLKGIKMRILGLGGDVMAKLGVSPVALPGGHIYENLISGTIDATKWSGPYSDYFMKFYEAAKYCYYPSIYEPGAQLTMGINASWWGDLSKNQQAIIKAACNEEHVRTLAEINSNNSTYFNRLITDHGVQFFEFNEDIYEDFNEATIEVIEEVRDHSDLSRRIYDSQLNARAEIGAWSGLSDSAYILKRNAVMNRW